MKKHGLWYQWLLTLILILVILVSCSPAAPSTTDVTEPPVEATTEPESAPDVDAPAATELAEEPEAAAPSDGGTLVLGLRSEIINVDGTKNGHSLLNGLLHHIVEPLVTKDAEGNIQPKLATDWEISEDGRVWTFTLREGVTFHDGTPFNAEAVKQSFERLLNEEFNLDRRRFYAGITEIEVVDEHTVRFTTEEPWGPLLSFFTYIAAAIVSPDLADQKDFTHLVGTGPFKLESWTPGEETVLVRNEDYWGEAPLLERVVFREVPEDSTRIAMLQTGEIDVDMEAAPQLLSQFENNDDFVVVSVPSERGLSLDFNVGREPFDDVRVRQAVLHAINVDDIINGVMFGQASALNAFPGCTPQVTGCYEIPGYHDYNPDRARELLAEAGYPDGLEATMVYGSPRYPLHPQILTAIQAQLQEVGIELELVALEWGAYIEELAKPVDETSVDVTSWAWSSVIGDAALGLARLNSVNLPPACCDVMFYVNERVDELLQEADRATDPDERFEILKEIQEIAAEDMPILYLLQYNVSVVYNANVHDIEFYPNEEFSVVRAWKE